MVNKKNKTSFLQLKNKLTLSCCFLAGLSHASYGMEKESYPKIDSPTIALKITNNKHSSLDELYYPKISPRNSNSDSEHSPPIPSSSGTISRSQSSKVRQFTKQKTQQSFSVAADKTKILFPPPPEQNLITTSSGQEAIKPLIKALQVFESNKEVIDSMKNEIISKFLIVEGDKKNNKVVFDYETSIKYDKGGTKKPAIYHININIKDPMYIALKMWQAYQEFQSRKLRYPGFTNIGMLLSFVFNTEVRDLYDTKIYMEDLNSLTNLANTNPNLTTIKIEGCIIDKNRKLNNDDIKHILYRIPHLKSLKLIGTDVMITPDIHPFFKYHPSLIELQLENLKEKLEENLQETPTKKEKSTNSMPKLPSKRCIDAEGLKLLSQNNKITNLSLGYNLSLETNTSTQKADSKKKNLIDLSEIEALSNMSQLKHLNLKGNNLTDQAISPLTRLSNLESLDLSNNPITLLWNNLDLLNEFLKIPNLSLEKLNLNETNITSHTKKFIAIKLTQQAQNRIEDVKNQEKKEKALEMIEDGLSDNLIVKYSGLTLEEIKVLKESLMLKI